MASDRYAGRCNGGPRGGCNMVNDKPERIVCFAQQASDIRPDGVRNVVAIEQGIYRYRDGIWWWGTLT